MNREDLFKLKPFHEYTYGYNALRKWKTVLRIRENPDWVADYVDIAEDYCMICEQFLKHIIVRTEGLSVSRLHTHSYRGLADDAEYPGRNKHATLLRRLTDFYNEGRYIPSERTGGKDAYQTLHDFFKEEETYEEADEMIFDLYTMAQDADRVLSQKSYNTLTSASKASVNKMNLT